MLLPRGPTIRKSLSLYTLCAGSLSSLDTASLKDDLLRYLTTLSEVGHVTIITKSYSDHCVSALVLAPFFVHLEVLFKLGYKPAMFRQLQNDVGAEIAKFRKIEGDKKRDAERRTQ
jgi:hypothetical protein